MAGLLPASDSDSVVRATAKGRVDPFANVVLQTVVERVPTSLVRGGASAPVAPRTSTAPRTGPLDTADRPTPVQKTSGRIGSGLGAASVADLARQKPGAKPTQVAVAPKPIPVVSGKPMPSSGATPALVPVDPTRTTALRDLPKPSAAPQPALASAIQVSGVAQVNGQTQVILKLPNESFSRYVSVGERVMDGKVLIKRVENPSAITPVVILEEIGMEVPRKVGEKPVIAAKDAPR
jgi:hypothetical protein